MNIFAGILIFLVLAGIIWGVMQFMKKPETKPIEKPLTREEIMARNVTIQNIISGITDRIGGTSATMDALENYSSRNECIAHMVIYSTINIDKSIVGTQIIEYDKSHPFTTPEQFIDKQCTIFDDLAGPTKQLTEPQARLMLVGVMIIITGIIEEFTRDSTNNLTDESIIVANNYYNNLYSNIRSITISNELSDDDVQNVIPRTIANIILLRNTATLSVKLPDFDLGLLIKRVYNASIVPDALTLDGNDKINFIGNNLAPTYNVTWVPVEGFTDYNTNINEGYMNKDIFNNSDMQKIINSIQTANPDAKLPPTIGKILGLKNKEEFYNFKGVLSKATVIPNNYANF